MHEIRAAALEAVGEQERARQLVQDGLLEFTADDPDCPDIMCLAALAEELGEVARCLHDHTHNNLRGELIQLAGIALAWSTRLERTTAP